MNVKNIGYHLQSLTEVMDSLTASLQIHAASHVYQRITMNYDETKKIA